MYTYSFCVSAEVVTVSVPMRFTFTLWNIATSSLKSLRVPRLAYLRVYICSLSFPLRKGHIFLFGFWFGVCQVILNCILDIVDVVLYTLWILLCNPPTNDFCFVLLLNRQSPCLGSDGKFCFTLCGWWLQCQFAFQSCSVSMLFLVCACATWVSLRFGSASLLVELLKPLPSCFESVSHSPGMSLGLMWV